MDTTRESRLADDNFHLACEVEFRCRRPCIKFTRISVCDKQVCAINTAGDSGLCCAFCYRVTCDVCQAILSPFVCWLCTQWQVLQAFLPLLVWGLNSITGAVFMREREREERERERERERRERERELLKTYSLFLHQLALGVKLKLNVPNSTQTPLPPYPPPPPKKKFFFYPLCFWICSSSVNMPILVPEPAEIKSFGVTTTGKRGQLNGRATDSWPKRLCWLLFPYPFLVLPL